MITVGRREAMCTDHTAVYSWPSLLKCKLLLLGFLMYGYLMERTYKVVSNRAEQIVRNYEEGNDGKLDMIS
jgi:hypothetical protein